MPGQVNDDRPTIYLHNCGIKHLYVIKNKDGKELTDTKRCSSDREAIEWARAWASSWPNWILECKLNKNT